MDDATKTILKEFEERDEHIQKLEKLLKKEKIKFFISNLIVFVETIGIVYLFTFLK